jgi:predicted AlkP superfamily pyrophosphatase or phosphodiesterase
MPKADDAEYIKHLACSPFGNIVTLDAAREIVVNEKLGCDKYPDVLAINLSSTDYVGHGFGPYSLEVEDMTCRTDQQLGDFMRFLDKQVGSRGWMLFLTADHGVAPIPERATTWGLRAKRNPFGDKDDRGNYEQARQQLEGVLRGSLGEATSSVPFVDAVVANQVFLNLSHPQLQGANAEFARRLTRDHLVSDPFVAHAATRDQLLQDCSGNEMLHMLQRSFHARRSGDVLFVLKPYSFSSTSAATHGSPWHYDRHVPLMIVGNRQATKSSSVDASYVSPAQIAPTIARILRIETPSACTETRLDLQSR